MRAHKLQSMMAFLLLCRHAYLAATIGEAWHAAAATSSLSLTPPQMDSYQTHSDQSVLCRHAHLQQRLEKHDTQLLHPPDHLHTPPQLQDRHTHSDSIDSGECDPGNDDDSRTEAHYTTGQGPSADDRSRSRAQQEDMQHSMDAADESKRQAERMDSQCDAQSGHGSQLSSQLRGLRGLSVRHVGLLRAGTARHAVAAFTDGQLALYRDNGGQHCVVALSLMHLYTSPLCNLLAKFQTLLADDDASLVWTRCLGIA